MLMPTLCIKSLSNGISAAILFIPFYLSCSKFLLDFFLGKVLILVNVLVAQWIEHRLRRRVRQFDSDQGREKTVKLLWLDSLFYCH